VKYIIALADNSLFVGFYMSHLENAFMPSFGQGTVPLLIPTLGLKASSSLDAAARNPGS
jgi:hypothetical protein